MMKRMSKILGVFFMICSSLLFLSCSSEDKDEPELNLAGSTYEGAKEGSIFSLIFNDNKKALLTVSTSEYTIVVPVNISDIKKIDGGYELNAKVATIMKLSQRNISNITITMPEDKSKLNMNEDTMGIITLNKVTNSADNITVNPNDYSDSDDNDNKLNDNEIVNYSELNLTGSTYEGSKAGLKFSLTFEKNKKAVLIVSAPENTMVVPINISNITKVNNEYELNAKVAKNQKTPPPLNNLGIITINIPEDKTKLDMSNSKLGSITLNKVENTSTTQTSVYNPTIMDSDDDDN